MPLPSLIREEASRLGFAAVGFAAIGPCQTYDRFKNWLNRGYAGGMTYLARHALLRADLRQIMPEARSIIVVAARYPADPTLSPFSNYCRGRDYHDILRGKLKQLARSLEVQSSIPLRSRICVDSAPVLEREWAVRAGLGWIGKQGSLVNPEWGCTLFLGELLVNLELAPSKPKPSKCGTCRRCVEACPTGAIQPDGLIDARRCIAYLTIEHKGEIPEDLHPLIGASLFGCDRCTVVCPFNPVGDTAILPEFSCLGRSAAGGNPVGTPMPTAEQCLTLSEADFQQRFRGTAVYRSGLACLKRNATVAMAKRITPKK
ncbi:MAG: tRNA epoxyqueuosine(34) reductase QueG [Verrucomicrobia bacterium]|nr:tRNA epoxyqueuosine(34) reductase QueG [Verrucomicrobiota bacterium]MBU1733766.1 tRNA epoxyqueuosine(34) reductase QueG [Verrucomicrobiota bacterium]MBU1856106.1 tRNA epoxyqueuosine(34) reductase QueG [Verrucomicrobiota bacterium]